ncbi:MAG: 50S ribosomal protein L5 [Firmicutes bacterium ADurb.Bin193]|nr:MAG: 50S ribosomal protein L5 [Firmicutes bacterium ADurb.Bin193]
MARMKDYYLKEIAPALMKKFSYKSTMEIPKLEKIVVNMGVGDAKDNAKALESAAHDMSLITGQKAQISKAKKSVAAFKVRAGMNIGCKATLRGDRMYEFLDRLFNVALPRVRDFRGINGNSFDGRGNYTFGIKEQIIFPEIEYDKIDKIRGMDIVFVTTAKTDEEAKELLSLMGAPFIRS